MYLETTYLEVTAKGKLAFTNYGECEIIGFVTGDGCPEKRIISCAKMLVKHGVEVIVFVSYIFKGTPIEFPCSHATQMSNIIHKVLGNNIVALNYMN